MMVVVAASPLPAVFTATTSTLGEGGLWFKQICTESTEGGYLTTTKCDIVLDTETIVNYKCIYRTHCVHTHYSIVANYTDN